MVISGEKERGERTFPSSDITPPTTRTSGGQLLSLLQGDYNVRPVLTALLTNRQCQEGIDQGGWFNPQ